MSFSGPAKRVRIYVKEHDRAEHSHEPLWHALVELLRKSDASGVSVYRAVAGFGVNRRIHTAGLADVIPNQPLTIEWVDTPEKVELLLPQVLAMVASGMVTVEDTDVVQHSEPRLRD